MECICYFFVSTPGLPLNLHSTCSAKGIKTEAPDTEPLQSPLCRAIRMKPKVSTAHHTSSCMNDSEKRARFRTMLAIKHVINKNKIIRRLPALGALMKMNAHLCFCRVGKSFNTLARFRLATAATWSIETHWRIVVACFDTATK